MTDQTEASTATSTALRDARESEIPPAGPMVSIGVMVDPYLLARLDRLRACLGDSRSRVMELVMTEGPIELIEQQHTEALELFNRLAERAGVPWWTYTLAYALAFARQTYPPTVATIAAPQAGKDARDAMVKALKVVKANAR